MVSSCCAKTRRMGSSSAMERPTTGQELVHLRRGHRAAAAARRGRARRRRRAAAAVSRAAPDELLAHGGQAVRLQRDHPPDAAARRAQRQHAHVRGLAPEEALPALVAVEARRPGPRVAGACGACGCTVPTLTSMDTAHRCSTTARHAVADTQARHPASPGAPSRLHRRGALLQNGQLQVAPRGAQVHHASQHLAAPGELAGGEGCLGQLHQAGQGPRGRILEVAGLRERHHQRGQICLHGLTS